MTLDRIKAQLKKEHLDEVPFFFVSSTAHNKSNNPKVFIRVALYQTNKFDKFETNKIGYGKPISKSINYLKK